LYTKANFNVSRILRKKLFYEKSTEDTYGNNVSMDFSDALRRDCE